MSINKDSHSSSVTKPLFEKKNSTTTIHDGSSPIHTKLDGTNDCI